MGEIKSALEIALERTKGVAADKEAFNANKYKKEGKKIVSKYLEDHKGTMEGTLAPFKDKELSWVKQGIFESLTANLLLPQDHFAVKKNLKVGQGYNYIIKDKKNLKTIFEQLESFFKEYIDQRQAVKENLEKQFAPRMEQKQQEMSKKLGGNIHLEASSDPEFIKYLKQAITQLEDQYIRILIQVKDELKKMFESSL